jgi:hypothetical protein
MGGSNPVMAEFAAAVVDDLVVLDFGPPDDGDRAPNARFRLEQFHGATEALLRGFAGYERRAARGGSSLGQGVC